MQYCYFDSVKNMNPGRGDKYRCAILMSDYIYNMYKGTDHEHIFATGPEEGFDSLEDLRDYMIKQIQFNPVCVDGMPYLANSYAIENNQIINYIKTFNGRYEEYNEDMAYTYPAVGDTAVGYNYLSQNGGNVPRASNSFFGSYNPLQNSVIAGSALWPSTWTGHDINFTHKVVIHPEKLVVKESDYDTTGTFNWRNLDNDHDDYYRICYLQVYIYRVAVGQKWHFECSISNAIFNIGWIISLLNNKEVEVIKPKDPYGPPDNDNGGHGNNDPTDDPIDFPDLPPVDISAAGAVHIYKMTGAQMAQFCSDIRSVDWGQAILNLWQRPIQAVVGCYTVGYPITSSAATNIKVLGLNVGSSTGQPCPQFQEWDVGTYTINRQNFGDNFTCYSPYMKISIYLPYIGLRQLDTDEVMGKTIHVHYTFDNTCGQCVACIKVGDTVKYSFTGNAAAQIPLSQEGWGQNYIAALTVAAGAISGGVAGFMGGGGALGVAGGALKGGVEAAGGSVGSIIEQSKPSVEKCGAVSGAAGLMGIKACYLLFEWPASVTPTNFLQVAGQPSAQGISLGALSGYNIIESCHLHGIAATGPELDEIESLLKGGCVF